MGLKLLWLAPQVTFHGKGIITAWGEEMIRQGWELVQEPPCDLVFFGSDSMLRQELLEKYPTLAYFWGWPPVRLLDPQFQAWANGQLELMSRCTRLLVPSPCVWDQLCDFGLPSQVCLPGVDARALEQGAGGPRENRVVFIGRFAPHKNLPQLIHALAQVNPPPPLLVLGPGNRKPFEERARQLGVPISFAEPDDAEKAHILKTSAVLVHASNYEGFGLPPVEALYCGTPVIASLTPHNTWLLMSGAYFFSTEEQLARLIVHVLEHPQDAQALAARGQENVRAFLTLEHASQRLWAHIHQAIKEHLGRELREKPGDWAKTYDAEHRRNWAYSVDRFDPTWARHWRAQTFIALLKECGTREVLDVGCGAVYPTIFARAGFTVHAVDISQECLDQVVRVALKWGVVDKVTTYCQDALDLKFPPSTFDAVVQAEIWEHVPDTKTVIEEGLRVLKPGGYLIATTPIGHAHWDPMHMGPVDGGWDDATLKEVLKPWEGQVKRFETIAEEGAEPSCYLVVLEKPR